MGRTFSARQAARTLQQFARKDYLGAVRSGMRDRSKVRGKKIREDFKKTRLGRALWGTRRGRRRKYRKPPLSIRKRGPRKRRSGGFIVQWNLKGTTAILEKGGRFKPHRIVPVAAKRLVWNDGAAAAASVRHPGAKVRRDPVLRPNLVDERPEIQKAIDAELVRRVRLAGLD